MLKINPNTLSVLISIINILILFGIDFFFIPNYSLSVLIYLFTFLINLFFVKSIFTFSIFKELDIIYDILNRIKKKNYELPVQRQLTGFEKPLDRVKEEIIEFARNKQIEIEELKKLESFRREFLADVSHELKTPIFAAQGYVETLIDGAVDDITVRDKFLQKASKSLDGLNIIVQDLIIISQLEIGEIKMNFQHFDLLKLTEDIYEQCEDSAFTKGIKLKFNKFNPKSCYVLADKNRIGQVMTNLIVNAVKYGKENGKVEVFFIVEPEEVIVSVIDDGPGIESKHLNRIFERFYRVEKSRSKEVGGTGLGLAIVKHIVEAHHSNIEVQSKIGYGTTFTFRLKKGNVYSA